MTKLIFITHPSVVISADVAFDEWPVSAEGERETQTLIQKPFWSEVTALYASTEPKSHTTAECVGVAHGLAYEKREALKEIDRSSTALMPKDEYMRVVEEFYALPDTNVRGWESAAHARQRIKEAVEGIMKQHPNEVVAIIGHGATGTLLACEVKGIPSTMAEDPKRTACIMEIDWDAKKVLRSWEAYGEPLKEARTEFMPKTLK